MILYFYRFFYIFMYFASDLENMWSFIHYIVGSTTDPQPLP